MVNSDFTILLGPIGVRPSVPSVAVVTGFELTDVDLAVDVIRVRLTTSKGGLVTLNPNYVGASFTFYPSSHSPSHSPHTFFDRHKFLTHAVELLAASLDFNSQRYCYGSFRWQVRCVMGNFTEINAIGFFMYFTSFPLF